MKLSRVSTFAFVAFASAAVLTGCAKKQDTQLSDATGFETTNTEELAQLPQSTTSSTSNQQGAVEVLPIETAPVTQGAALSTLAPIANEAVTGASATLSQNQKIQTALKNAGLYSGKIDGKIGPGSKQAIKTFQEQHSLKVDGKVGPKTWAALEPYLIGAAAQSVSSTGTEE